LKYQQLVKKIKAPEPAPAPEVMSISDDEREWMVRVGRNVKHVLGSIQVQDVGQVVVGFDM